MHQIKDFNDASPLVPFTTTTISSERLSSLSGVLNNISNQVGDFFYHLLPGITSTHFAANPLLSTACQQAQQCLADPPRSPRQLVALLRNNLASAAVKSNIEQLVKQQQAAEAGKISLLPEIIEPLIIFTPAQLETLIGMILPHQNSAPEILHNQPELYTVILNEIYRAANKDLPAFSLPPAALEKLSAVVLLCLFPFSPILPANENKFLLQQIMLLLSDFTGQNLIEIHRQPFSIFSAVAALISLSGKAFNAMPRPTPDAEPAADSALKHLSLPGFRLAGSAALAAGDNTTVAANSCALFTSNQPQKLAFCPPPGNSSGAQDGGQPPVLIALALSGDQQQAMLAIQTDRQPVVVQHHRHSAASLGADWPTSRLSPARLMISDSSAPKPPHQPAICQPAVGTLAQSSPTPEGWLAKLRALLDFNINAPFSMPSAIRNLMLSPLVSRMGVDAAQFSQPALNSAALWHSLANNSPAERQTVGGAIYNPRATGDRRRQFTQLLQQLPFVLSYTQQENLYHSLKESLVILSTTLPARSERISEQESHQRCLMNAAIELEQAGEDHSLGGKMISWGEGMHQQSLATFRTMLTKGDQSAWLPAGIEAMIGQLAISLGRVANGKAFKPEPCQDRATHLLETAFTITVPPEGAGARAFRPQASKMLRPLLKTAVRASPVKGVRVTHPETGISLHTVLQSKIEGKQWHIIPQGKGRGVAFQPGQASSASGVSATHLGGNSWSVGSLGAHPFSRADQLYVSIDKVHYLVKEQAADGSLRLSNGVKVWFDVQAKQWKELCPGNIHLDAHSLAVLPERLLTEAPGNKRVLAHAKGINPESKLWRDHHGQQDVLEVQVRQPGSNKVVVKYMPGKREGNFFTVSPASNQPVSQQQVLRWNPMREKWDVASPFSQLTTNGNLPLVSSAAGIKPGNFPGLYSVSDRQFLLRWSSDATGNALYLPLTKTQRANIFRSSNGLFFRFDTTAQQWSMHRITAEAFIDVPESVKLRLTYPFSDDYAMPGFRNSWRKDGRIFIKISDESPELATYIEVSQQPDQNRFILRIPNQQGPDTLWKFNYQDDEYILEAKEFCVRAKRASDDECVAGPSHGKRPAESEGSANKRQRSESVDTIDSDLEEALDREIENTDCMIVARGQQALIEKITDKMTVKNFLDIAINLLHEISQSVSMEVKTEFIRKHFGEINLARKTQLFDEVTNASLENLRSYLAGGSREDQLVLAKSKNRELVGARVLYNAKVLSYQHADDSFMIINYDSFKEEAERINDPIVLAGKLKTLLHEASHIKRPVAEIEAGENNIATRDFYYSPSDQLSQMSSQTKPYDHRIMHYSLDNDLEITEANENLLERKSYSDFIQEHVEDSYEYHLADDEKNFYSLISETVKAGIEGLKESILKYNMLLDEIKISHAAGEVAEEQIQYDAEDQENLLLNIKLTERRIFLMLNGYNEALQALAMPEKKLTITSLLREPDVTTGEMAIDNQKVEELDAYLAEFAKNKEQRVAVLMKTADNIAALMILLAGEEGILDRILPDPLLLAPDPTLPWEASSSEDSERR